MYGYISHMAGKGVGYKTGYSTVGLFVGLLPNQFSALQPFLELRGHYFNDGRDRAANIGLGSRYFVESWCCDWVKWVLRF